MGYSPWGHKRVAFLVLHGFNNDNAAVLHVPGDSTSCALFCARPVGFVIQSRIPHRTQRGIHGFLVEQEVAQFVAGGHIPLPIRNGMVLMHEMPRVLLVAPSDGGIMVEVVVRHEDVGA